jgi:hypothetical protein
MLTIRVPAEDIVNARLRAYKRFPVEETLCREDPYGYCITLRANLVCAVIQYGSGSWLKIRFPAALWDWGIDAIAGKPVKPITLEYDPESPAKEERILVDPYVKDFRHGEWITVPVVEARWVS